MMSKGPPTAIFPLFRTKERENIYQWGGPLARFQWGLYQLANATVRINSLAESKKAPAIGTFRDDSRVLFLKKMGFTNIEVSNNYELNIRKLLHDRLGVIIFSEAAIELLKMNPEFSGIEFRVAVEFAPQDWYIAFSNSTDPGYVREWNATFKRLLENGVIQSIWDKSHQKELSFPFK